ncbi:MAG TPA: hypothetical protein VGA53_04855 [Candidatus Paceibacterota bacterium]
MQTKQRVQELIAEYQRWYRKADIKETEDVIAVDEVIARVASFYEKIRGIVDWREEHLLRKTAIERILKRRMATNNFDEDFAERFLSELVRGGHFPNRRITYVKVEEIQRVVEKYLFILQGSPKKEIEEWLFSLAAVEVEEELSLPLRERALINFMTEDLNEGLAINGRKSVQETLSEEAKILQLFVAVQRAMFKLDNATITFHILERFYADWQNPSQETLEYVRDNVSRLYENIKKILDHPYAEKFYQTAEKFDTPYLLLHDVISSDPEKFEQLLEQPAVLEEEIRQAYNRRHSRLRGRLMRAAFYSTISIFITKILAVLAVEIPVERYFGESINFIAIGLSVSIPALLMLVLVLSVKTTSRENFERVTIEVMKILQERDEKTTYTMALPKNRSGGVIGLVYGFYGLTFLLSFGVSVYILGRLHFPPFSIFVFLMFLSLVLFGGTRIRQRARELMIEPEKENFAQNLLDIFSLPMIQVGRVLSAQIARYNIVLLALNFLIEVPFQMFVEFLEQWRGFLREKKEEIH